MEYRAERWAAFVTARALSSRGVPVSEHEAVLEADAKNWEETGECPERLAFVIKCVLSACAGSLGYTLSQQYFDAHTKLTEQGELSARSARQLLGSARLAAHLLADQRMSCAQAARVLSAPFNESTYTWQQVQVLCRALDIPVPAVSAGAVEQLYRDDASQQVSRFADSTDDVERELLAKRTSELGFHGDHEAVLNRFMRTGFDPALRIIAHHMLTVCEFYDHPPSIAYEFSPRGTASRYLQNRHPTYRGKGSAILNLAKSAPSLDDNWAWGRKQNRRSDALALSALFFGLEQMAYSARRELAAWLRQWIVRTYARATAKPRLLEAVESGSAAIDLINRLIARETHTSGTVEQRVVDTLTAVLHPDERWHSRGRGDSVNAANLPRKKMGDCEYLRTNAQLRTNRGVLVAYEAHAGTLNDAYIEGHHRSLMQIIEQRDEDLAALAKPDDWNMRVTFVAHERPGTLGVAPLEQDGYRVHTDAITYSELLGEARVQDPDGAKLLSMVNEHLIEPLNLPNVMQPTRDRVDEER